MVNKRAWTRIIEAFFAIVLISGVFLVAIGSKYESRDFSSEINEKELEILREIELNNSLREVILDESSLPVNWSEFDSNLKTKITERVPGYLECNAKICELEDDCSLNENLNHEVYAQSIKIFADREKYKPRKLKLFCWRK